MAAARPTGGARHAVDSGADTAAAGAAEDGLRGAGGIAEGGRAHKGRRAARDAAKADNPDRPKRGLGRVRRALGG